MRVQITCLIALVFLWMVPAQNRVIAASQRGNPTQSKEAQAGESGTVPRITEEIRHRLVMMPYYGVFDWLEGTVLPDGTVTLQGQVTRDTTKSDAEYRAKKVEGVSKVNNEIEVLPLLPSDDAIRIAMYRAIFKYEGSLFRYATLAVPPIHIIVKNGRVWLKGYVANEMDKQVAYTYARGVSGVFEVNNELKVDKDNY